MALKNVITLNVDIKKGGKVIEPTVVQNDSVRFIIVVQDGGKPLSAGQLSEIKTVTLANVRPDRQTIVTEGTLLGDDQFIFDIGSTETDKTGKVRAMVQMYDANGRVSSLTFSYTVVADPTGQGYEPSEREQTLIEVVLGEGPLVLKQAMEAAEIKYIEPFSMTNSYKKNNLVSFGGSSYFAKKDTKGNEPPNLPEIENEYWGLAARKGADGTGVVVPYTETFKATKGMRIINLKNPYDQFQSRITATVGGVPQKPPKNFEETSATSITFYEDLPEGVEVVVEYFSESFPLASDIQSAVDGHTQLLNNHTAKITQAESELENVNQQLAQTVKLESHGTSFVDKLLKLFSVRGMYVVQNSSEIHVGIGLENDLNSVIEYRFRWNTDGLLLLRGVYTGVQSADITTNPIVTTSGTYNTNSAPIVFTTTVGDTFTFEFTGTQFSFYRRVNTNGGAWKFELDSGQSKVVSCYASALANKTDVVFDNLPYGTYKVIATFIGQDPFNPIAETPRGYLMLDDKTFPITATTKRKVNKITNAVELISSNSIPDFAVSAKPVSAVYGSTWIPIHGSGSGASASNYIKLIIDGKDVITAKNGTLPEDYYDISSIQLVQFFKATNTNAPQDLLWNHYVTHAINVDNPYLEISNRLEFLQQVKVNNLYLTMLPISNTYVSRLVLNNGVEYNSLKTDGSDDKYGLDVSSAMFAGMYEDGRTHGCAIDVGSYAEASGLRKLTNNSTPTRINFRADGICKFYIDATDGVTEFATGDVVKNTQRICCITGVKFPNNLLVSL